MKRSIVFFIMVLCLGSTLLGNTDGDSLDVQHLRPQKSTKVALGWALGSTIIPSVCGILTESVPLCVYGGLIGPSVGHFYASQWGRGFKNIGIRAAIVCVGFAVGCLPSLGRDITDISPASIGLWSIAGAATVAHIIYDIASTPSSVRRYNELHTETGKVLIIPNIDIANRRSGISVVYRF